MFRPLPLFPILCSWRISCLTSADSMSLNTQKKSKEWENSRGGGVCLNLCSELPLSNHLFSAASSNFQTGFSRIMEFSKDSNEITWTMSKYFKKSLEDIVYLLQKSFFSFCVELEAGRWGQLCHTNPLWRLYLHTRKFWLVVYVVYSIERVYWKECGCEREDNQNLVSSNKTWAIYLTSLNFN